MNNNILIYVSKDGNVKVDANLQHVLLILKVIIQQEMK